MISETMVREELAKVEAAKASYEDGLPKDYRRMHQNTQLGMERFRAVIFALRWVLEEDKEGQGDVKCEVALGPLRVAWLPVSRPLWIHRMRIRAARIVTVCLLLTASQVDPPGAQYRYEGTTRYPVAGGGHKWVVEWEVLGRRVGAEVWTLAEAQILSAMVWSIGRRDR